MIRKDVVIAILTTFCLTVTLFMIVPTRSNLIAGDYDPWADINDDGKINMYDIGYIASRFGTLGDTTKNVNVTNLPTTYDSNVLNFPAEISVNITNWEQYLATSRKSLNVSLGSGTMDPFGSWNSSALLVDGYKTYYLYVNAYGGSTVNPTTSVIYSEGGIEAVGEQLGVSSAGTYIFGPYSVKSPELRIYTKNNGGSYVTVNYSIYAIP